MGTTSNSNGTGQFVLVASEVGVILFLLYALSSESAGQKEEGQVAVRRKVGAPRAVVLLIRPTPPTEKTMRGHPNANESLRADVHVDLRRADIIHLKIDNVRLHLCHHDLSRLTHALEWAAERVVAAGAASGTAGEVSP